MPILACSEACSSSQRHFFRHDMSRFFLKEFLGLRSKAAIQWPEFFSRCRESSDSS